MEYALPAIAGLLSETDNSLLPSSGLPPCHNLRKYYFSARVINIWNSLPNCVVDVSTINQFKARLDKFWLPQDILYDYTADLTRIGDRSVHVTKDE